MTRSTSPATYDEDFFTWTQEQAAALRAGRRGDLDIEHLAEEVEDLGKRDLRDVRSLLDRLLTHLLKIEAEPDAPSVPHWRSEVRAFARSAARAFSPGMMPRLDLPELWNEVFDTLDVDREEQGRSPLPRRPCPFVPADLLTRPFDVDGALAKMKGTA